MARRIPRPIDRVPRTFCPLRRGFFERPDGVETPTPAVALLRTTGDAGAKGGGTRIALLLSMLLVSSAPPYTSTRPPSFWASMLGHPDPFEEGARTVRAALRDLEDRGFLSSTEEGSRRRYQLLDETLQLEDGEPSAYTTPYEEGHYVSLPRALWEDGLMGGLTGAALVTYLAARGLASIDDPEFFVSEGFWDSRFGISRASRKRGLSQLVERGMLSKRIAASLDEHTWRRGQRAIYTIEPRYRAPLPAPHLGDRDSGAPSEAS